MLEKGRSVRLWSEGAGEWRQAKGRVRMALTAAVVCGCVAAG